MTEYCPHCKAKNSRVRSEVDAKGWLIADDYCGQCGRNLKRPEEKATPKVRPIEEWR